MLVLALVLALLLALVLALVLLLALVLTLVYPCEMFAVILKVRFTVTPVIAALQAVFKV